MRVLARDNKEVDDGWLCDKGRFGYQAVHSPERITEPLVRDGGSLRPVLVGAGAVHGGVGAEARGRAHRRARGRRGHQRGGLPRPAPAARRARLAARRLARPAACSTPVRRACSRGPTSRAAVPDIDYADVDPGARHRASSTRRRSSTCACARRCAATGPSWWWRAAAPGSLDPNADAVLRFAPGAAEAALVGLASALHGEAPRACSMAYRFLSLVVVSSLRDGGSAKAAILLLR